LLTPEEAHHEIQGAFSPSGKFFVETYSTVDTLPKLVLRSLHDGRVIAELESADATGLFAAGWRAPERFAVKAADGVTDIWTTVYLPPDFDPERSYPIIDAIYGGPVSVIAARTFRQSYASGYQQASLARLGFIVVSIDGRGTPYRSRAFREAGYGNFADPQLEDHVSAIRQIAERYPSVDLDRVGIYGHSNGGYMAARALLKYPDFFTVGIASAGPHNFQGLPGTGMPWMGIPQYEGGVTTRPNDAAVPDNYRILDNANFASGLQGRLLLICGDMDNTAFPALTLQLAEALNRANKSYDLLYLPNRTHSYFVDEPYVMRRIWDYFVEHLLGVTPPINYKMKEYETPVYQ
jgi:dipeptidyl aminopeptidase/acylaminoacyl peptidase